jgi:hypothetical protein
MTKRLCVSAPPREFLRHELKSPPRSGLMASPPCALRLGKTFRLGAEALNRRAGNRGGSRLLKTSRVTLRDGIARPLRVHLSGGCYPSCAERRASKRAAKVTSIVGGGFH